MHQASIREVMQNFKLQEIKQALQLDKTFFESFKSGVRGWLIFSRL